MGVCEMFRVTRQGILCIEARDSLLMRLAVRVGLTAEFELESAFLTEGGVGRVPEWAHPQLRVPLDRTRI